MTQIVIHDRNEDGVLVSAKRLDLVLRLVPLLRKQVVGKRLLIEEPTLTVRRDRSGHWNVLDREQPIPASDEEALQMLTRIFRIREATLVNGTIIVIDEARPDGPRTLKLQSVEAALEILLERGQADLHVSASQQTAQGLSAMSLSGTFRKAEQQTLAADEAKRLSFPIQFDGLVETANLSLRDAADFFGPRPVPELLQGRVNAHSAIKIFPGVAGYDVVLSDLTGNMDQLSVTGKASLSGLLAPQPTFAVTFSSSPIQIGDLLSKIPPAWFHPQLPSVMEERQIKGVVEVVSATVTGSYVDGPRLAVTGEFHVQNGEALLGQSHVPAKDLDAQIIVEAGRIRVSKLSGLYGTIHMTDSKGQLSFLEQGPWVEMEISGTMAAADLLQFLATTVKSELLSRVLASSRDVEGVAMPVFRLVGPPSAVTFAGGEIKAQHVNLTNQYLPERLTALQGRFVLAEGETQFDQVTAHLGDLTVQVQGGITGGTGSMFRDLAVRVTGDATHMAELLPAKSVPQGAIEGLASAIVVITGATSAPHLRGEVGLTDSRVTVPSVAEKPTGAPVTITFEGDVLRSKA